MNEKSILVHGKSKLIHFQSLDISFTNWQKRSFKFQKWQNQSLGIQNLEFNIKYPCTIHKIQIGTFLITFEYLHVQSLKNPNLHKWSLRFKKWNFTILVLVLFTYGNYGPCDNFEIITKTGPLSLENYIFGPFQFTNQTDHL